MKERTRGVKGVGQEEEGWVYGGSMRTQKGM